MIFDTNNHAFSNLEIYFNETSHDKLPIVHLLNKLSIIVILVHYKR